MKKLLYASVILFCAACGGNTAKTETQETAVEVVAEKHYACPMKCEGEKTYEEAGKCPVCKMDLQEIALAETDSTSEAGHAH